LKTIQRLIIKIYGIAVISMGHQKKFCRKRSKDELITDSEGWRKLKKKVMGKNFSYL